MTRTSGRMGNPAVKEEVPEVRRSFVIDEEGDFDDDEGWWVIDEETGEEGFLSQFDDTFYTPKDEWGTDWEAALVVGRFLRKNNGKGRKGKKGQQKMRKNPPEKKRKRASTFDKQRR